MGRLRWFDLAAAVVLLAWVLESQLAHAPFGLSGLQGWAWWRAAIGEILLPLPGLAIYFALVWWAARRPLPMGRKK